MIDTGGIPGGLHGGDPGAAPYLFFRVDDIDAALARVRELGGTVEDMDVEGDADSHGALRALQALPRRPGVAVRPAPAARRLS